MPQTMAHGANLSQRPTASPLQSRKSTSQRRSHIPRLSQSPATPAQTATGRRHASYTPHYASATATSASRKRTRQDRNTFVESQTSIATPRSDLGSAWAVPSLESSAVRSDFASPEPFVNTRYNIAGGLDTPAMARESACEKEPHDYLGVRRRWQEPSQEELDESPQCRVRRHPSSNNGSPQEQKSWTQFVFGVAGKVWHFGSSAFKGFYAGGGQGYAVDRTGLDKHFASDSSAWESMRDSQSSPSMEREMTPLPGSYPTEDNDGVHAYQRPAKRLHAEGGESPWVLIDSPTREESARKNLLHKPPPPSRVSSHSRRLLVPVSRRSSSYLSPVGSPMDHRPQRVASYAHQRSSSDVTPATQQKAHQQSPLSPEAHKYLADRRREEKQQDASIRRMNEQLRALLKEGRQALGTKVEVFVDGNDQMDVEDEGYFEDGR